MRTSHVFSCLLPFLMIACEKNPMDAIDSHGAAPFLQSASVSPTSVDLDAMSTTGSSYQITVLLGAVVNDAQGAPDIAAVSYVLWGPGNDTPVSRGTLTVASSVPATGTVTCTGTVVFPVTRSQTGTYRIEISATDNAGRTSSRVSTALAVIKGRSAPVISLPGARTLAASGTDSTLYGMTITASDSNGLGEISLVTVKPSGTRNTSAVTMFDDGLPSHGDALAGDGIYSTRMWLAPLTSIQEVVFEYQAFDKRGQQSNVVHRQASNDPPHFVRLSIPATIQHPSSGTTFVSFFATVADNNGLDDIDSVYFRNLSSATPTSLLMYDDGDLVVHGDSVAHDATYSRIVSIDASTATGIRQFQFSVTDRAGARADTVRNITIN